jgi:hypothetical protein
MTEIDRIRTEQYIAAIELQNISRRHQSEEQELRTNLDRLAQTERERILRNRKMQQIRGQNIDCYA